MKFAIKTTIKAQDLTTVIFERFGNESTEIAPEKPRDGSKTWEIYTYVSSSKDELVFTLVEKQVAKYVIALSFKVNGLHLEKRMSVISLNVKCYSQLVTRIKVTTQQRVMKMKRYGIAQDFIKGIEDF